MLAPPDLPSNIVKYRAVIEPQGNTVEIDYGFCHRVSSLGRLVAAGQLG